PVAARAARRRPAGDGDGERTTMTTPNDKGSATRRSSAANPAPRPALARVRPLADHGSGGPTGDGVVGAPSAAPSHPVPAGRALLAPDPVAGGRRPGGTAAAAAAVPSLAELMPPAEPGGRTKGNRHGHGRRRPSDPADAGAKQVELVISLPKPLRKRLKA